MLDWIMGVFSILLYLFEGYCIQFLFRRFAEPKLYRLKNAGWVVGIVWIVIRILSEAFFYNTNSATLIWKLLFSSVSLFAFCLCWYRGNFLLKLFLVVQFVSLRELAFWAGYSLLYVGNRLIDLLIQGTNNGIISLEYLPVAAVILSCVIVIFMEGIQGALLFISIWEIVKSYHCREKGRMDKEVVFYLFPAVAGVLIAIFVRLLMVVITDGGPVLLYEKYPILYLILPLIASVLLMAIVFSFRLYQNMTDLQEERTERVILENQITQMQNSIAEMEHLYDGVRSVKHDMNNHMAVLQNLIQKRYQSDSDEDAEIIHYFKSMYQSVEQLDVNVHTGNTVSDVVISNKFHYAQKQLTGIRLDASDFMLSDVIAVKSYDIGIILNNGLDNAIEACMEMRRKQPDAEVYITIKSFRAKNMYFIEIENPFDGVILLDEDSGFPISTKEDKEVHGIGLKNIKNCAVKYGGDMDCIVKDGRFLLSVMVKG